MALTPRPRSGSFSAGLESRRFSGRATYGSRAATTRRFQASAREQMAEIIRRYRNLINRLKTVTPEAMEEALQPVYDKSQEYCPVDTGALINSGVVEITKTSGGKTVGYIKYGDAVAWYAAIVHERMDLNHEPPTRAKFLQSALEEEFDNFLVTLALRYGLEMHP